MRGVVKHIHRDGREDREFFFVTDQRGVDRFAHRTALADPGDFARLQVGQYVEFEAIERPKGPAARQVRFSPFIVPARLLPEEA